MSSLGTLSLINKEFKNRFKRKLKNHLIKDPSCKSQQLWEEGDEEEEEENQVL